MTDAGRHHLELCFERDGTVNFYPKTDNPAILAARLAALIRVLVEHPTAIQCAAGYHPGHAYDGQ